MIQKKGIIKQQLLNKLVKYAQNLNNKPVFPTRPLYPDNKSGKVDMITRFKTLNIFENEQSSDFKKYQKTIKVNYQKRIEKMNVIRQIRRGEISADNVQQQELINLEEKAKTAVKELIIDSESGLAFDYGFDDIIFEIQEKRFKKQEQQYSKKITDIINNLRAQSEENLILLYSGTIAKSKTNDFKEKARELILQQLIKSFINLKKKEEEKQENNEENNKIIEELMYTEKGAKEYVMSEFENMSENVDFSKYLERNVKQEQIDKLAYFMAKEETEQKAIQVQNAQKDLQIDQIQNGELYVGFDNVIKNDPNYEYFFSEESSDDLYYELGTRTKQDPTFVVGYDKNQYTIHNIYRTINRRYFKKKTEYLQKLQYTRIISDMTKQNNISHKKVYQILDKDFFSLDWTHQQIEQNQQYIRLTKEPNLQQIYENIDYMIENMTEKEFIKRKIQSDITNQNYTFKPTFVSRQLDSQNLMWEGFQKNFDNITNNQYRRNDFNSGKRIIIENDADKFIDELNLTQRQIYLINTKQYEKDPSIMFVKRRLESLGIFTDYKYKKRQQMILKTKIDEEDNDGVNVEENLEEQDQKDKKKEDEIYDDDVEEKQYEEDHHDENSFENFKGEKPTILDLNEDQQRELEVYHSIKSTPFFKHHLLNSFSYFQQRNEHLAYMQANNYMIDQKQKNIEYEQIQQYDKIYYDYIQQKSYNTNKTQDNSYAFAKGTRKSCRCLAIVKPGNGKITVNRIPFLQYFPMPQLRIPILVPVELCQKAGEIDIDFHIRGGGISAQPDAARTALAKALAKKFPESKKLLKITGNFYTDNRKVERKKCGLLKARKRPPYIRR